MPRVKLAPVRRKSCNNRMEKMEVDDADESVLDDEEVRRIEAELANIRRRKSDQIQKIRRIREEKRQRGFTVSSSDSDDQPSIEDDYPEDVKPRVAGQPSARILADGLDKTQQRFMFNVKQMEEKYAERERRALPESLVEIDRDGNFFFPENMAGCHQQAFINKMFLNDAKFGKGLVSAPRNSIQSFDGDVRAMRKCQELDEKFGRKMRKSGVFEDESSRRRDRLAGSEASGITLRTESASTYYRFMSGTSTSDYMEDDVFSNRGGSHHEYQRRRHAERLPTTSTMASFFAREGRKSEGDNLAEDEDGEDEEEGEEDSDGGDGSESEEDDEEEEKDTPVAPRQVKRMIESKESTPFETRQLLIKQESLKTSPQLTSKPLAARRIAEPVQIKMESATPTSNRSKPTRSDCSIKMEVDTPKTRESVLKRRSLRIPVEEEKPRGRGSNKVPEEVEMVSENGPLEEKKVEKNRKITDFLKPVPKSIVKQQQPSIRQSPRLVRNTALTPTPKVQKETSANAPRSEKDGTPKVARAALAEISERDEKNAAEYAPAIQKSQNGTLSKAQKSAEAIPMESSPVPPQKATLQTSPEENQTVDVAVSRPRNPANQKKITVTLQPRRDVAITPPTASERPTRNRKPTSKVVESKQLQAEEVVHHHCHDHGETDEECQPSTSTAPPENKKKKQNKNKEPVCKHCEYIKEEKRQARLSGKMKKTAEVDTLKESSDSKKIGKEKKAAQSEKKTPKDALKTTGNVAVGDGKDTPKIQKSKKNGKSPKEESTGTKRRSATVVADEPEMKKKKLTEMDILSIPSSMAVAVDTELIAAENSQLVSANLPKFSEIENSKSESIWNASVSTRWLNDLRNAAVGAKDLKLFGVSTSKVSSGASMIGVWVSNIQFGFDKDPFESDLRRLMAQDKQERQDVKAGYDFKR